MAGNKTKKEILFIRDADPRREHTTGHLLTKAEAREKSGIEEVRLLSEWDGFLTSMANRRYFGQRWVLLDPEFDTFFDALKQGRARLALVFGARPGPRAALPPVFEHANALRDRFIGATLWDATDAVAALRQVKTPYEQKILRRGIDITTEAHLAAARTLGPGKYEYEVESALEAVYLAKGAMSPGYPSIVGSGPNSTILHYEASQRQMQAGDVLLIDAAANYQGLTGDLTRTWPVSGKFTKEQADIYRLVFEAQEAGIKAVAAGRPTADIEKACAETARAGLMKLGLITEDKGDQFRTWYTHGISHWIGVDVHDAGDYRRPLAPGMTFTIEPGIYIREAGIDTLPETPENKAFAERVRPVVKRYANIGVRIEDSFLLTDSGVVNLTAAVPRKLEDVEALLAKRK
jgi:Xaa-Pro aminopeptidase